MERVRGETRAHLFALAFARSTFGMGLWFGFGEGGYEEAGPLSLVTPSLRIRYRSSVILPRVRVRLDAAHPNPAAQRCKVAKSTAPRTSEGKIATRYARPEDESEPTAVCRRCDRRQRADGNDARGPKSKQQQRQRVWSESKSGVSDHRGTEHRAPDARR